jgi:hypothetical protein
MMTFQHHDRGVSAPDFKSGLRAYVQGRWPTHTLKNIERCWDLTPDEAKRLLRGEASLRTVEKILSHKNGGWSLALPILGGVIGHGLTDFIASERNRLDHEAEQRRIQAAELGRAAALLHAVDGGPCDHPRAGMGSR